MVPQHDREALLAGAGEDPRDIVIVTDANGLTLWVNEAFGRVTGYAPSEIAGRKPGHLLQGPQTDAETVAAISRALRERRSITTAILNYARCGAPIWLDSEISPMFDKVGRLAGYIAIERVIYSSRRAAKPMPLKMGARRSPSSTKRISTLSSWIARCR